MKVTLRPLTEVDAYTSIRWRQDPEVWKYTLAAGRDQPSLEDELQWIRRVSQDPTSRRFALLAEGRYIGNVYLTGIDGYRAEYHIFIGDRDYWGRGLAREATAQALLLAREEMALKRVYLLVHADNRAAVRIYRSLGFEERGYEGVFISMSVDLDADSGEARL